MFNFGYRPHKIISLFYLAKKWGEMMIPYGPESVCNKRSDSPIKRSSANEIANKQSRQTVNKTSRCKERKWKKKFFHLICSFRHVIPVGVNSLSDFRLYYFGIVHDFISHSTHFLARRSFEHHNSRLYGMFLKITESRRRWKKNKKNK